MKFPKHNLNIHFDSHNEWEINQSCSFQVAFSWNHPAFETIKIQEIKMQTLKTRDF